MNRSALVIAHPGHELRVFGWYEQARPRLFVLTCGSRSGTHGRLSFSQSLAEHIGATPGSPFGRYLDRQIYQSLLAGEYALFVDWTVELSNALVTLDAALVVTDSWQMYNVAHDLVHVMARVASERAAERLGHPIEIVEYMTAPAMHSIALPEGHEAFRVELDEATLTRKKTAAYAWPDLQQELNDIVATEGLDALRTEIFRKPIEIALLVRRSDLLPPYDRFGAERVAAGIYRECIRWRHVQPVVEEILRIRH